MSKRSKPAARPATEQVRVTWNGDIKRWVITYPTTGDDMPVNNNPPTGEHWTTRKRDAVTWARDWIKRGGVPAELRIHKKNGEFQEGRTYFRKDARSPG